MSRRGRVPDFDAQSLGTSVTEEDHRSWYGPPAAGLGSSVGSYVTGASQYPPAYGEGVAGPPVAFHAPPSVSGSAAGQLHLAPQLGPRSVMHVASNIPPGSHAVMDYATGRIGPTVSSPRQHVSVRSTFQAPPAGDPDLQYLRDMQGPGGLLDRVSAAATSRAESPYHRPRESVSARDPGPLSPREKGAHTKGARWREEWGLYRRPPTPDPPTPPRQLLPRPEFEDDDDGDDSDVEEDGAFAPAMSPARRGPPPRRAFSDGEASPVRGGRTALPRAKRADRLLQHIGGMKAARDRGGPYERDRGAAAASPRASPRRPLSPRADAAPLFYDEPLPLTPPSRGYSAAAARLERRVARRAPYGPPPPPMPQRRYHTQLPPGASPLARPVADDPVEWEREFDRAYQERLLLHNRARSRSWSPRGRRRRY